MPTLFQKRDFIIRHLIIALMSFFFAYTASKGAMVEQVIEIFGADYWRMYAWNFLFIATIWNGNIALIQYSPYDRWNWETQAFKKIVYVSSVAIFWPIGVNYFYNLVVYPWVMHKPCELASKENIVFLILSVAITLFINAVFVALEFFSHWRKSLTEREALKRSTITAEFESLKNQVNPHFLFNALNTLSSLIEEEPKIATEFVQQLASVYRYLLSQNDKETVSLGEELAFMRSYVFLNQIRFGQNLKVEVHVPDNLLNKEIITLTLQILLENAIKHNVISLDKPLSIVIEGNADSLCVRNNLQEKVHLTPSNGIGLANISSRYKFFGTREVSICKTATSFEVCVPLM
ncbi:MAG: sensor protein lytS [Bacteroidetes bacterium B1(2017)]|nr:MAG: sensor protein lytS [Bacteroidetes bacterium B1(2017)]